MLLRNPKYKHKAPPKTEGALRRYLVEEPQSISTGVLVSTMKLGLTPPVEALLVACAIESCVVTRLAV